MRDQLAVPGEHDSLGLIHRYVDCDLPATVVVEDAVTRSLAIGWVGAGSGVASRAFAPSAA